METATTRGVSGRVPGVLDPQRRALTLGLLMTVSLAAFEAMAVATILPVAAKDLGWPSLYGWSFSAFLLTSLVATIAASQRADQHGPAAPYLAGIAFFACGLCVAGLAPSMPLFILGRALQCCGAGAILALSYVSVGRGYPDTLRARMLALMASAWVIPSLIGPAMAAFLADALSWRAVFIGLLPLLVLAAILQFKALGQLGKVANALPQATRLPLAIRLAAGAGLGLAGLEVHSVLPACALVVVGLLLALPALRRLMPAGTLTARAGLPAGLAIRGLLTFCYFGVEAFIPLGLTTIRHQSTAVAGAVLTTSALTWTTGSWLQARLDTRDQGRGRNRRVLAGLVIVLVAGVITAFTVTMPQVPVLTAAIAWTAGGLGMGMAYPSVSLIVLGQAAAGEEGAASGSLLVAETLLVAVATGLGGAAVGLGQALDWAPRVGLGVAYALALAGGICGMWVAQRLQPASLAGTQTA